MIRANLDATRERIRSRCIAVGRSPDDVTLVAVTKTFPVETVREAVRSGVTDVGENYVQELTRKRDQLADPGVRWHFIGHLQRNKVKTLVPWVHLIHAVDNLDLAREIDRRARDAGRTVDFLVEVNTTGEESKFGIPPQQHDSFCQEP